MNSQELVLSDPETMKGITRFLWGGLGALAPTIVSLSLLDIETITLRLEEHSAAAWITGYSVRVTALFVLGGLWAYLHKTEHDTTKLFQLGIVGPALITGMLNASNAHHAQYPDAQAYIGGVSFTFIEEAHAHGEDRPLPPSLPPSGEDFIKGIIGRP